MRESRRAWPRCILIAALAVFALLGAADLTLGVSPRVCGACHGAQFDGTTLTTHAGTDCLACHLDSGGWSYPGFKVYQWTQMYPGQLLSWPPPPARDVAREACVRCHESAAAGTVFGSRGVRIAHVSCARPPAKCSSCHGAVSHAEAVRWGGQLDMDECVRCHAAEGASQECDACHEGRLKTDRLRRGPWRVTHGPEWAELHAMGSYEACATCHDSLYCAKCHNAPIPHPVNFGTTHGRFALLEGATCDRCHQREPFCDGCHVIAMPHPAEFLETHPEVAASRDDPLCHQCHEYKGCTRCHDRHDAHPRGPDMQRFRGLR